MGNNLRYALRSLRKNPAFTAVAVLSLALGIGANAAIFSLMDRVILRHLPVPNPGELVLLTANGPRPGSNDTEYDITFTFSYPGYRDFRDGSPVFHGVLAWYPVQVGLTLKGQTERVEGNLVSGNYFDVLGVKTALGRPITNDDARAEARPVAVLSHTFWERRFGADASILNQTVRINGQPVTVIGVAEAGFAGLAVGESPAVFVPVTMSPAMLPGRQDIEQRRVRWLNLMARLKPGISRQSAETAINVFWRPILEEELKENPQAGATVRQRFLNRHLTLRAAANGISSLRPAFGTPLELLMALAGLVLLIACANVANLMIARAAGRQKEIAIRLAVGASRRNIVQQILVESLTLSLLGGAVGVILATWSGAALLRLLPLEGIGDVISSNPDLRVLAFTAALCIGSAILFGLVPALQATRPNVSSTLKAEAGSVMGGFSQVKYRKALVVAQVSLSLVLLIGAGMFIKSLENLQNIDFGFRADHLMSFSVEPSLNGYDPVRAVKFYDQLTRRIEGLPGVSSVAATQTPLMTNTDQVHAITVPGREPREGETSPNVDAVSPGFFSALGMPLIAGRELTRADAASAPKVAVVNETFARWYFDRENALGRQFYLSADTEKTPIAIVGIVKDGKYADLREEKQRFVFLPYAQHYGTRDGGMTFYVRTRQDPEALAPDLRQVVREADANLPVFDMKTMERTIGESVFADRMIAALSAVFGLLATTLAAIGLYGVMSYTVTRRTREIGIRMALGAGRKAVLSLVLGEVALLVAAGIAIAVPLSFPLTALAQSVLFGVAARDPVVIASAASLLAATGLVAGYIPAARAVRVDPLTALRYE